MNEELKAKEIRVIKEVFDDEREVIGYAPEDMITINGHRYEKGDIFLTDTGELIDLEIQIEDFDKEELCNYVKLAEELYKINKVEISIYILCSKEIKITSPEGLINSKANFCIRIICLNENPIYELLSGIKEKIDKKDSLNDEDLTTLMMIPDMVPKRDKERVSVECFELLKKSQMRNI